MNGSRFFSIIFVSILALVGVVLLIQIARAVVGSVSGDSSNENPATSIVEGDNINTQTVSNKTIEDFISSKVPAVYTRDGEITANETHYSFEIEVTPTFKEIRIIKGYNGVVESKERFKNNEQAYEAFMYALSYEGILETKESLYPSSDGVCATGERFTYSLDMDGLDSDVESWATTCSTKHGNFAGDRRKVQKLFENQIPDYRSITRGIRLNY